MFKRCNTCEIPASAAELKKKNLKFFGGGTVLGPKVDPACKFLKSLHGWLERGIKMQNNYASFSFPIAWDMAT